MSAKADPPRGYRLSALGYRRDTMADKRWPKADSRPSVCRSHRRKASGAIAVPPAGFVVDRTRIRLGGGARTFAAAKAALERWEHFRLGWVEAWPPDTPIQAGRVVAVIARLFGLWWLNTCRIVYVVDEEGPVTRYGFAYSTLSG